MALLDAGLEQLSRAVGDALLLRGWRLASAESCTGGWLGASLTAIAGSSSWYEGGVVSYSNAVKIKLLDVAPELLEHHGAVSEPVAAAMALGARRELRVDMAVAITGVAGPTGGTATKPVGLVCFAWATSERVEAESCHFEGDRDQVRAQAVGHALAGVLQRVQRADTVV